LNRLINRVLIGEPKKVGGIKTQEVRIVYNFVGGIVECSPHFAEKRVFSGILQENMIKLNEQKGYIQDGN